MRRRNGRHDDRHHTFARACARLARGLAMRGNGPSLQGRDGGLSPGRRLSRAQSLGSVPFLEDQDGVAINESVAMMLYLAQKYGPTPLLPDSDHPRFARVLQMTVFGETAIGMSINPIVEARFLAPDDDKRKLVSPGSGNACRQGGALRGRDPRRRSLPCRRGADPRRYFCRQHAQHVDRNARAPAAGQAGRLPCAPRIETSVPARVSAAITGSRATQVPRILPPYLQIVTALMPVVRKSHGAIITIDGQRRRGQDHARPIPRLALQHVAHRDRPVPDPCEGPPHSPRRPDQPHHQSAGSPRSFRSSSKAYRCCSS